MIEVAHIVARITTDMTRFNAGMAAAEARAKGATARMSLAGARMSKYLTLPLLAVGYSAVKASTNFETAMMQIHSQAGATMGQIAKFRQGIRGLSSDSVFGPEDLAKGLYHVQSVLGNDGPLATYKNKIDVLRASMKMAQIGGTDLEDTTSALTGAFRTQIKGTETASSTWHTLNGIVGSGNMRMHDLVEALGTGVLPVAKLAGLTLTDVGASMAVFTDENMNASEAMTRFRTSMMMMQNPSKNAEKALANMGLSGEKLGVSIRENGFIPTVELIRKRYMAFAKGVGEDGTKMWQKPKEAAEDYLNRIGDTKAFGNMAKAFGGSRTAGTMMLLVNQAEMLKQKEAQIRKTAGKSDKAVEDSNKTAAVKMKKAWTQVRMALIDLGVALTPIVLGFLKVFTTLANGFSHLDKGTQKFIAGILVALAVLGPFLIMAASLIKIAKDFKLLFTALRGLSLVGMGPVGWAILIIAVIAIVIWKVKFLREHLKKFFKWMETAGPNAIMTVLNFVKAHWPYIVAALAGPLGVAVLYIVRHFHQIIGKIKHLAQGAFNAAKHFGHMIVQGIKSAMQGLGAWMEKELNPFDKVGRWFGGKVEGLTHRAMGGPVSGNRPYMVGENGPELFLPTGSGRIQANRDLAGASGARTVQHTGPMVNIESMHVRDNEDIELMSARLARKVTLR